MNTVNTISNNKTNSHFQKVCNWFVFFIAIPGVNLLGNSITFYFLLYLMLNKGFYWHKPFYGKKTLFFIMFAIIFSALVAPYDEMPRYRGFFATLEISIQYVYWILTSAFFIVYYKSLDIVQLSKYLFFGLIVFTVGFYFLDFKLDFAIGSISTKAARNAFVYNMLCCVPLSFIYIKHRYGLKNAPYFLLGALFVLLFTNGRSGGIIIMIETMIISAMLYPKWLRVLKVAFIPLVALFLFFQSDTFQPVVKSFASAVSAVNPRLANMITGADEEGNLTTDKSWLERKLQVSKGLEIIEKYPLFGVGVGNYTSYDSDLESFMDFDRLSGSSKEYYNTRSSHNSYVLMLGEFGLFGFIGFMILFITCLFSLGTHVMQSTLNEKHLPLVSLIGAAMHFYAINAIIGSITYLVFGLALAVSNLRKT